jgi:DNA-directed RNA polymerase subunit M/transcription elongation factor TFIIS
MKFCYNCNNILSKSTNNNILKYICNTCLTEIPATVEDTLMLHVSLQESETLYKSEIYLNLASKDNMAPLINKQCNKCSETIIRQIVIGDNGEAIYVCPSCNNKFMQN